VRARLRASPLQDEVSAPRARSPRHQPLPTARAGRTRWPRRRQSSPKARRPASFGAARTCRDRLAPAEAKREQLGVGGPSEWGVGRKVVQAVLYFETKRKLAHGGPRCSDLGPLLPLPCIHTTKGCFGEARSEPERPGAPYMDTLTGTRETRGVGGHAGDNPARSTALDPRGAALSRPRGSCWAGSRPPEAGPLASRPELASRLLDRVTLHMSGGQGA